MIRRSFHRQSSCSGQATATAPQPRRGTSCRRTIDRRHRLAIVTSSAIPLLHNYYDEGSPRDAEDAEDAQRELFMRWPCPSVGSAGSAVNPFLSARPPRLCVSAVNPPSTRAAPAPPRAGAGG